MSDWLERELTRGLVPVAAPANLRVRLGFAPAKRWEFPRVVLAVAAAVVLVIGGGYATNRTAALDLHQRARALRDLDGVESTAGDPVVSVAWLHREAGQPAGARLLRCDGGASAPFQANAAKATVLLAHAGPAVDVHTPAAAPDAGCHLCHSL
jgi:hypothetical protein